MTRRHPGSLSPIRQPDRLRITIERATSTETDYYRANVQQVGVALIIGGRFRPEAFLFQAEEIQKLRQEFETQVLKMHAWVAQGLDPVNADMSPLAGLGHALSSALPSTLVQGIAQAVWRARNRQRWLHITLEVAADAQDILALPWELLWLPELDATGRPRHISTGLSESGSPLLGVEALEQGYFLLFDGKMSLVRQVRGSGRNTPATLGLPLNRQTFAASPQGVPPIALEPTRTALQQTQALADDAACWYAGLDTLTIMQERLRADQPQVVHIICHGHQPATGRVRRNDLLLNRKDGLPHRVNAFTLASVLSLVPGLQLVVLQACHAGAADLVAGLGGAADDSAEEMQRRVSEGIALTLIRHGVPAVVAMQGAVGQTAASAFVQAVYATLAKGGSIEQAVAAGRVQMHSEGGIIDWCLPVLYQGSGLPNQTPWHERLAHRLGLTLLTRPANRTVRALLGLWVLVLLATGIIRLVYGVPGSPPRPEDLFLPLVVWSGLGVVNPMLMGMLHRGARDRDDLEEQVRRAMVNAQWTGAFVGYALGGGAGLGLIITAWALALFVLLPWLVPVLSIAVLVWSACTSYAIAVSQEQSGRAIGAHRPDLYDRPSMALIIGAMLLLLLCPPWAVYAMAAWAWGIFISPLAASFVLSLFLLALILVGSD